MKRQVACKIINTRDVGNDVFVRNLPSIPLFELQSPVQRLGAVDIFHPEPKNKQSQVQQKQSAALQALVLREVEILKTLDHVRCYMIMINLLLNNLQPNVICLVQVYQSEETLYVL